MRHLLARLIAAYESAQVELHGKYSVERVAELHAYQRKYPLHRCLLLLLTTPLPCLTIIVLTDLVPLTPISDGPAVSHVLWVRVFIVALAIAATLLEQGRHFVPGLPCSTRTLWAISVFVALCSSAYARLLGSLVGFPTPFLVIMCSPCFLSTLGICGFIQWGHLVRAQLGLQTALVSYVKIMVVQFTLTALYPGYNYLFLQHSGPEQTAIAMLLPVLKLLAKNAVSLVFNPQLEDFRPGVVILNVEVFHALFVSCCMQSSTSWVTTVALMCTDFIHSWFGVRDIDIRLAAIKTLEDKLYASAKQTPKRPTPLSLIEKSLFFVRSDHAVRRDASVRHRPAGISFVATPWSAVVPFEAPEQVSPPRAKGVGIAPTTNSLISGRYDSLTVLTTPERVEYVSATQQVLHIAEFLLLVEFVEVVIPVIYCVYMTAMFFLPNRMYYPQLAQMDAQALLSTIGSVIAYAALEFVSFVALCFALRRKLQVSPIHQLAYVIHTQWNLVQSKMILWVVFSVHVTLEHFGYDYSFRFKWLTRS